MSQRWLVLIFVFGCTESLPTSDRPDATASGDADTSLDSGSDAASEDSGSTDSDAGSDAGDLLGEVETNPEICDNVLDDDRDGRIDEGCDCVVGTSRACNAGPQGVAGIGTCRDGMQTCESLGATAEWSDCVDAIYPSAELASSGGDEDCDGLIDEDESVCVARMEVESGVACRNGIDDDCDGILDCDEPNCPGVSGCPTPCASSETYCHGNYDEDCDGMLDCEDPDCEGDPSCDMGPCPPGQTPIYTEQDLGSSPGSSSIRTGNGRPIWEEECGGSPCDDGQVLVRPNGSAEHCVPPPSDCPPGQYPSYVGGGTWQCQGPCDWIIHYGHIYDFQNHCADRPMLSCPDGQVPTFVLETRNWQCRDVCNNFWYDRIYVDGMLYCIPC